MQPFFKHIHNPSQLKKVLLAVVTLALWCFILWRALNVFGPSNNNNNVSHSSDGAIPVLMSNDDRPITIFNLYYYGADRWGGWPFLVAQAPHRITGYRWSDQSLFTMQTIWVFVGVLVIACLSWRDFLLVTVIYLMALCLNVDSRYHLFELSQLYGWQVTALLLGWYSLRRLLEQSNERSARRFSAWRVTSWRLSTLWFSFLAIWSSVASIPLLLFLLCLETTRTHWRRVGDVKQKWAGVLAKGAIPIAVAVLAERLMKQNYRRHASKHYGHDFATRFAIDTGYLEKNLALHFHSIIDTAWALLFFVPALALVAVGAYVVYLLLKKKSDSLRKLRTALQDDLVILALGAYGIAVINFVMVVLVSHVRLNAYDNRFLSLTNLFAPISGLLTLYLVFRWAAQSFVSEKFAKPTFILGGILMLVMMFPPQRFDMYYDLHRETALALAQRSPGGILMGGYWQTYVFASLQPFNTMTPVPVEGQENRMPWTREQVRQADHVVVEYRASKLTESGQPPERLSQYGNSFRLIDPKWYENEHFAFALYARESQ